jgi:hypothetical protein
VLAEQRAVTDTSDALRAAVADQEAVIARLERLAAAAAGRVRELEGWKAAAEAQQATAEQLRQELDLATARAAEADAAATQRDSVAAAASAERKLPPHLGIAWRLLRTCHMPRSMSVLTGFSSRAVMFLPHRRDSACDCRGGTPVWAHAC